MTTIAEIQAQHTEALQRIEAKIDNLYTLLIKTYLNTLSPEERAEHNKNFYRFMIVLSGAMQSSLATADHQQTC